LFILFRFSFIFHGFSSTALRALPATTFRRIQPRRLPLNSFSSRFPFPSFPSSVFSRCLCASCCLAASLTPFFGKKFTHFYSLITLTNFFSLSGIHISFKRLQEKGSALVKVKQKRVTCVCVCACVFLCACFLVCVSVYVSLFVWVCVCVCVCVCVSLIIIISPSFSCQRVYVHIFDTSYRSLDGWILLLFHTFIASCWV
jgi:hypothetical protein